MPIDPTQAHRVNIGFSEWAPTYDEETTGAMGWATPERLAAMLRPHLAPTAHVLDLGCGTGQAPAHLEDLHPKWTGVDLCTAMLRHARQTGRYARIARMNIERQRYPFPAAHFDAVLAAGVMEFSARLDHVLAQTRRILKPGGHFAFSVELPPRATQPARHPIRCAGQRGVLLHPLPLRPGAGQAPDCPGPPCPGVRRASRCLPARWRAVCPLRLLPGPPYLKIGGVVPVIWVQPAAQVLAAGPRASQDDHAGVPPQFLPGGRGPRKTRLLR